MVTSSNISIEDYNAGQEPVVFVSRSGERGAGVTWWDIPLMPDGYVVKTPVLCVDMHIQLLVYGVLG